VICGKIDGHIGRTETASRTSRRELFAQRFPYVLIDGFVHRGTAGKSSLQFSWGNSSISAQSCRRGAPVVCLVLYTGMEKQSLDSARSPVKSRKLLSVLGLPGLQLRRQHLDGKTFTRMRVQVPQNGSFRMTLLQSARPSLRPLLPSVPSSVTSCSPTLCFHARQVNK
jgi:hypothetical protein